MSRLGKYMVFNPNKDKPVKFYSNIQTAYINAGLVNNKEKEDVLIVKVVGIMENDSFKILEREYSPQKYRKLVVKNEPY